MLQETAESFFLHQPLFYFHCLLGLTRCESNRKLILGNVFVCDSSSNFKIQKSILHNSLKRKLKTFLRQPLKASQDFSTKHNFRYRKRDLTNAIPNHLLLEFRMTNATLFASIRLKSISINLDSWLYARIVVNPRMVSEKWEMTGLLEMLSIRCNSLRWKKRFSAWKLKLSNLNNLLSTSKYLITFWKR